MKNKEKYASEIRDIACAGSMIALKNGYPFPCADIKCEDCDCNESDSCEVFLNKWSEKEYIDPTIVLTDKQKEFFKTLKDEWKYITKTKSRITIWTAAPVLHKNEMSWGATPYAIPFRDIQDLIGDIELDTWTCYEISALLVEE